MTAGAVAIATMLALLIWMPPQVLGKASAEWRSGQARRVVRGGADLPIDRGFFGAWQQMSDLVFGLRAPLCGNEEFANLGELVSEPGASDRGDDMCVDKCRVLGGT